MAEPEALNVVLKGLYTVRLLCALNRPELKNKQKDTFKYQFREFMSSAKQA